MQYLWTAAQVSMGNEFLAHQNLEELLELVALLEVPDKRREVVESPERDLVATRVLRSNATGLIPQHDLSHHPHTFFTQNLKEGSITITTIFSDLALPIHKDVQ